MLDRKAPIDEKAIEWAAENGHLEIVELLLDREAPIDERTMESAVKNGHLEIVELLYMRAPVSYKALENSVTPEITKLLMDKLYPDDYQ
uniref:Ankyrin repeat protein n=1 Tax=Pithovirus LCDPAC01 TaxID=2506600 RepID=A0A481YQI6_9VIRU|nr:MAG: ankyrin repeat protein [Pithovirus LCDPAC01]